VRAEWELCPQGPLEEGHQPLDVAEQTELGFSVFVQIVSADCPQKDRLGTKTICFCTKSSQGTRVMESSKAPTILPSVLVVGANGFLGRRIPPLLSSRHPECRITLLDIAPRGDSEYDYFTGDITNLSSSIEIFQKVKPAVVIHCASPPIPTSGKGDEKLFHRVNVDGTRNVIQACREAGVRALVYTSSASVLYNGGDLVNANESTPYATRHVDAYNASKVS